MGETPQDQAGVRAAEPEGIGQDRVHLPVLGLAQDVDRRGVFFLGGEVEVGGEEP